MIGLTVKNIIIKKQLSQCGLAGLLMCPLQSHHKEDCVFNAHAHVAVELSVLATKKIIFYKIS